jgi:hypothetical protein
MVIPAQTRYPSASLPPARTCPSLVICCYIVEKNLRLHHSPSSSYSFTRGSDSPSWEFLTVEDSRPPDSQFQSRFIPDRDARALMSTYVVKHNKRIQIATLTTVGIPHHQGLYVMRRSKGRTLYRHDGIAEVIDLVPTNTLAAIVVHIRLGMRCKVAGEEDMFCHFQLFEPSRNEGLMIGGGPGGPRTPLISIGIVITAFRIFIGPRDAACRIF